MATLGRVLAIIMLACIPLSLFSVYNSRHGPETQIVAGGGRFTVGSTVNAVAIKAGARPGKPVDLSNRSVGDRVRALSPPLYRSFGVPVETRRGRVVVTLGERAVPVSAGLIAFQLTVQLVAIVSLVLAALVLWRKPSILTIAFGAYAAAH